jgi:CRP-like cAMP-binding protein
MTIELKAISNLKLIKSLSPPLGSALVQAFASIGQEFMLGKGEELYREGEDGDNTGVILISGSMEISHANKTVKVVKAVEILGEMQQMNETGQRVATLRATEPSTVLKFSWHDLINALLENPSITQEQRTELQTALTQFATQRIQELFESKR